MPQAVDGCARHGLTAIGLWRHKIAETGLRQSVRLVRDAGVHVSSVCRGGMFPAATASERAARLDDNRRAVDEAAELGADVLVLVCGPAPDRDLDSARAMVEEGIAALLPYARERGVKLGIEPLHPMLVAERSVIVSLGQAIDLAARFDPDAVGLVLDVYHIWWDPGVYAEIRRAAGRILGFHVCDWLVPTPELLAGRGMMGDGVIEIRRLREAVDAAGYAGPIEVEVMNRDLWSLPGDEALALVKERYRSHV